MLEVFALIALCITNSKAAKARGRGGVAPVFYTLGLWLGLEFIGGFIGALLFDSTVAIYMLAILFAIIGGVSSALIARRGGTIQQTPLQPQYTAATGSQPPYTLSTGSQSQAGGQTQTQYPLQPQPQLQPQQYSVQPYYPPQPQPQPQNAASQPYPDQQQYAAQPALQVAANSPTASADATQSAASISTILPRFCASCGAPTNESSRFCAKCGAQVV